MAYSDYGAFVWFNGVRREDKEDVALFASDEETFGVSSDNVPSGARIWLSILKAKKYNKERNWISSIHHGIMGDGNIRVLCHKQGLPQIYEATEDNIVEVQYPAQKDEYVDYFDYDPIDFEYKGYKFHFESGKPYYAQMITPSGDEWECRYDYWYGAGF